MTNIPAIHKEVLPKGQDVASLGNSRRVGSHDGKGVGIPDQKPGGHCANRRLEILYPLLEVLNLSVRLPKRLDLITVIITLARVENIAVGVW